MAKDKCEGGGCAGLFLVQGGCLGLFLVFVRGWLFWAACGFWSAVGCPGW